MTFIAKQHDTFPPYIAALRNDLTGSAIDLGDATDVYFTMRVAGASEDVAPKIYATVTVDDAPNGLVSYHWAEDDLDTNGKYEVECEIHWDDGTIQTVPNDGYNVLVVQDDLDT